MANQDDLLITKELQELGECLPEGDSEDRAVPEVHDAIFVGHLGLFHSFGIHPAVRSDVTMECTIGTDSSDLNSVDIQVCSKK